MRRGFIVVGLLVGAALSGAAHADTELSPEDVIASYCTDADYECTSAPLVFEKTIELPIAFDWDTGWIPKNSDLQARFFIEVPASTTVQLDGFLENRWPDAMTLSTPGDTGGLLAFDYGVEIGAEAKIDVSVFGVPVSWTGDIPFVPSVDFRMTGATSFRSWAFADEAASASGITKPVRLFEVNLMSLAGIPSQLSKGGVALDLRGELEATYRTERIRIEPASGATTDITAQAGTTQQAFGGGAFVEYDVWPEGVVSYTGTIHLAPTLFAKILTKEFSMPLIDLPVSMKIADQSFVFDPVRVHVPLPDLAPAPEVLDFGKVNIGDTRTLELALENLGEARARAVGTVASAYADRFTLDVNEALIEPNAQGALEVAFSPDSEGAFETELTLLTNDPDARFQKVTLRGTAVTHGAPTYGNRDVPSRENGACACTTPGGSSEAPAFGALALALALGMLRRRR